MDAVRVLCRSTLRRRVWNLLLLALLTAAAVGFSLTAANGARRSISAFDRLVDRTDSDAALVTSTVDGLDSLLAELRARPEVLLAAAFSYFPTAPEGEDPNGFGMFAGIGRGFGETVIRPVVLEGRLADPTRIDEISVNRAYAELAHLEVGDTVQLVGPAGISQRVTLVGIHLSPLDVGPNGSQPSALGTPAFGDLWWPRIVASEVGPALRPVVLVRLTGGADKTALAADISSHHPGSAFAADFLAGDTDNGLQAEATAFWALCAGASLAALTVLLMLAGREIDRIAIDAPVLRAMGMSGTSLGWANVLPVASAVAAGLVISPLIAMLASPLVRAGVAAKADPTAGIWFDGPTLTLGLVAALVAMGLGLLMIQRVVGATHRRAAAVHSRRSRAGQWSWLPLITWISMAAATNRVSPARRVLRSTLMGIVVFGVGLIAALTWLDSQQTLSSTPLNQGWAFDASIEFSPDSGPSDAVQSALLARGDVVGLADYDRTATQIGGGEVDVFAVTPLRGSTFPTMRTGRPPSALMEVVVGPRTMTRLDTGVGQHITVDGAQGPADLRVVGEAIFPFLGNGTYGDTIAMSLDTFRSLGADTQISGVLVSLAPGADPASLRSSIGATDQLVIPRSAPLPPEVAHLADAAPIVRTLAWFYATLCVIALASGIVSAARRRSNELAVLQTLGATRRQVISSSVWLAATLAVAAFGVSVAVGSLAGKAIWTATVANVPVLESSSVPVVGLVVTAVCTLATAVVVGIAGGLPSARASVAGRLRAQ